MAGVQSDLITAEQTLAHQQNVLKDLISDSYVAWHDVYVQPAEKLVAVPQSLNVLDSWQRGLSSRPDLLQAKLDVERQGVVIKYDKNQVFPQIDLTGSYGHSGTGVEFKDTLGRIQEGSRPDYSYGAELTIPLGNFSARAHVKQDRKVQDQLKIDLKRLEQQIMIQIDDAVKAAQASLQRVDATRAASSMRSRLWKQSRRNMRMARARVSTCSNCNAN